MQSEDSIPTIGTLVVVPIVNVYGFLNNSRTMPDGRDLKPKLPW